MKVSDISRRNILGGLALLATGPVFLPATHAVAVQSETTEWVDSLSDNGWPISSAKRPYRVEGTNQTVTLASGDTATILLHVVRRFSYEIDTLREGDLNGHSVSRLIDGPYASNYLSGTAIEIRPLLYPAGANGLFFPNELAVIRDILSDLRGTVAWGGDEYFFKGSHFQINRPPGDHSVVEVAQMIREWDQTPSTFGAGKMNAFTS